MKERLIEDILTDWVAEFMHYRERYYRKSVKSNTGKSADSFNYEVKKSVSKAISVTMEFADYSRFYTYKNKEWRQSPPNIDELTEWVLQKGVNKFKKGFIKKKKWIPKDNQAFAKSVAFGIATKYKKKGKKLPKRKRWTFNKALGKSIHDLYERLYKELGEETYRLIAFNLEEK